MAHEWENPTGSVKDRMAREVITRADVFTDRASGLSGPSRPSTTTPGAAAIERARAGRETGRRGRALGSEVDGRGVVTLVADVRIGAAFEQDAYDRLVARAKVDRRPQAGVARQRAALVDEMRMGVEDGVNRVGVALRRGHQQRDRDNRSSGNPLPAESTVVGHIDP